MRCGDRGAGVWEVGVPVGDEFEVIGQADSESRYGSYQAGGGTGKGKGRKADRQERGRRCGRENCESARELALFKTLVRLTERRGMRPRQCRGGQVLFRHSSERPSNSRR